MKGLFRFLCTLVVIVVVIALALVILDMTKFAHDPENATANAIITGARNLFPESWIQTYDDWRASFLNWLSNVLDLAKNQL